MDRMYTYLYLYMCMSTVFFIKMKREINQTLQTWATSFPDTFNTFTPYI